MAPGVRVNPGRAGCRYVLVANMTGNGTFHFGKPPRAADRQRNRVSACRTTPGSVVVQNGGSEARR